MHLQLAFTIRAVQKCFISPHKMTSKGRSWECSILHLQNTLVAKIISLLVDNLFSLALKVEYDNVGYLCS